MGVGPVITRTDAGARITVLSDSSVASRESENLIGAEPVFTYYRY